MNDSGMFRPGDVVIGSPDPTKSVYSATGEKLINDGVSIYGDKRILESQSKELMQSAIRSGGKPLSVNAATKGKPTTRKMVKNKGKSFSEEMKNIYFELQKAGVEEAPTPIVKLVTVQFENAFGKIKAKVMSLIEHDLAFMLVFENEDSMVFEPKIGEQLALHTQDKRRYDVYYPGVTFDSSNNSNKFMILFKVPEEDQE